MFTNRVSPNLTFRRAFTTKERESANSAGEKAKKLLDINRVILISPDISLPAGKVDYGAGSLNNEKSLEFYNFMKSYAGINTIKLLPQGELRNNNGFYCAYSGSSLTLGSHIINLEELTHDSMGNILSKETYNKVTASAGYDKSKINYENIVGKESPHFKALEEAFNNFKNSNSDKLINLKQEFENFKKENFEIIDNKTLFEILAEKNNTRNFREWKNQDERELFNIDIVKPADRQKIFAEIKNANSDKFEFAYFRQFLAEKNLENARKNLNKNGFQLMGDCLIGFSADEIWSNPKAFEQNAYIASADWGISALKFSEITDKNSESYKLLKQKISRFAKRYDEIRFDVGWAYAEPIIYSNNSKSLEGRYIYDSNINAYRLKNKLNDSLLIEIENIVKEVKGQDFNTNNLIYEIEAGEKEFSVYDWKQNRVIKPFEGRTIVQSTAYLNNGYATVEMMENKMKIPRENYIFMVGNHDHLNLKSLANRQDTDEVLKNGGNDILKVLNDQYKPLEKELKLNSIKSPEEFIKAKFGHLFLAKNIKLFFADVFGISEQFDSQKNNSSKNYRLRVPQNYEESYHKVLQSNNGFNLYESIALAMRAKGLDKTNKNLYNEISNYGKILRKKGALTEIAANKEIAKLKKLRWVSLSAIIITVLSIFGYKNSSCRRKH